MVKFWLPDNDLYNLYISEIYIFANISICDYANCAYFDNHISYQIVKLFLAQ